MTNAEAKEHLKDILADVPNDKCIDWIMALNTAIKALEQQPNRCDSCVHSEEQDGSNCYECVKGMADNFELMRDATEEERKSVKDYVESISKPTGVHFDEAQPKTGHWIKMGDGFTPYECSECEKIEFMKSNYCPNCGAKMEVEE